MGFYSNNSNTSRPTGPPLHDVDKEYLSYRLANMLRPQPQQQTRKNKRRDDPLTTTTATSEETSSASFSLPSSMSSSLRSNNCEDEKKNKTTTKKSVRFFNDKKKKRFLGKKKSGDSVEVTVHTFERVQDAQKVWWNVDDLKARKRSDAKTAQSSASARSYLRDSFLLYENITKGHERSSASSLSDGSNKPNNSYLLRVAAGLDCWGYRGLERSHGPRSEERKVQCQESLRSIVEMYRQHKNTISSPVDDDIHERVRDFSRNLTEKHRRLATYYGKFDALVVQ